MMKFQNAVRILAICMEDLTKVIPLVEHEARDKIIELAFLIIKTEKDYKIPDWSQEDETVNTNCEQCQDTGEIEKQIIKDGTTYKPYIVACQECCEHGDYDHGICGYCDSDQSESLIGLAESTFEGER